MNLVINGKPVSLDPPADQTVLQAVRELGLTGTKEGCASGDCGACTVMVGQENCGSLEYHTINSCIVPIGQLAGRHLVTVEGLANGAELHPAQAKMVSCHGSQCGYCTPGFVMSLAALVEAGAKPEREAVMQGISGNLCRCTGYRPIVDAGMAALAENYQSRLNNPVNFEVQKDSPALLQPTTEAELQQMIDANPDAPLVAGGTDWMLEVTQRYRAIPKMIDLSRVAELQVVETAEDSLVIGAAVPYTELESLFRDISAPLHELLLRLGSRQIRNSGTVGGNLANGFTHC